MHELQRARTKRLGHEVTRLFKLPTLIATIGLWLGLLVAGTAAFMDFDRRPGPDRPVLARWPATSRLARPSDRPTLILIAHPKCPCTRASLEQLAQIISRSRRDVRGYALFTRPSDVSADWVRTASWNRAAELPGFTPLDDVNGAEARLFGATTSGHVFLFDADGTLRFSGGITAARGTEGHSSGSDSILDVLDGRAPGYTRTPVFGCPINDSEGAP